MTVTVPQDGPHFIHELQSGSVGVVTGQGMYHPRGSWRKAVGLPFYRLGELLEMLMVYLLGRHRQDEVSAVER